ncbi:hypothetical protein NM208_g4445 [Fusarium decemcellulare]|uniref:Uncharacterized protein n=2 Tax=Fusarium decemcellulare TaxID=57161 RepID=A0ACC1SL19_9HYPO|nr:hypothetical protein NM208_g6245 [Fusarium decemcellulare]KAJ3541759.1 hypothetical protein NM208_g4445 [Fusarium decemcellulare]
MQRYTILDNKSHAQDKELNQRDIQINTLKADLSKSNAEIELEKNKFKETEKKFLAEQEAAAKKREKLSKEIQDLLKLMEDDARKDAKDAQRFAETRKLLDAEHKANAELQDKLLQAEIDLAKANAKINFQATEISRLNAEQNSLRGQLQEQKDSCQQLRNEKEAAEAKVKSLTGNLGHAQSQLQAAQKTRDDLKGRLENDIRDLNFEVNSTKQSLENVKQSKVALNNELDQANAKNAELQCQLDLADAATSWHPENASLFSAKQDVPSPLQQSIQKHEKNNTWARLSPWVGTMANSGTFFNSLDDTAQGRKLKTLEIYGNEDWITAYKIEWDNGNTKEYGNIKNGSLKQTIRQTHEQPIVAANIVTDRGSKYQTSANMALFGFDKKTGYHLVGEYNSPHKFGPWTKPVSQTSFAPALDGSWALIGVYGYFDGCIDAVGLVWGHH